MFKYSGTHEIDRPREAVHRRLREPEILIRCIPACESLVPVSPDTYRARIAIGLGLFSPKLEGLVRIDGDGGPERISVEFQASGSGSGLRGRVGFRLEPDGPGACRIHHESEVEVSGLLSMLAGRLEGGAKDFSDQFFSALDRSLAADPGNGTGA